MEEKQGSYWELFWRTGLPEAYVMSKRNRAEKPNSGPLEQTEKPGR